MKKIWLAVGLGILVAGWLFLWPKMSLFFTNDGDVFSAIHKVRANIAEYYEQTETLPADLSEIYVPKLTVRCFKSPDDTGLHWHTIKGVEVRPGAFPGAGFIDAHKVYGDMVLPEAGFVGEDSGKWIYDPQSGWVVLDCSGVDIKHHRPWWEY